MKFPVSSNSIKRACVIKNNDKIQKIQSKIIDHSSNSSKFFFEVKHIVILNIKKLISFLLNKPSKDPNIHQIHLLRSFNKLKDTLCIMKDMSDKFESVDYEFIKKQYFKNATTMKPFVLVLSNNLIDGKPLTISIKKKSNVPFIKSIDDLNLFLKVGDFLVGELEGGKFFKYKELLKNLLDKCIGSCFTPISNKIFQYYLFDSTQESILMLEKQEKQEILKIIDFFKSALDKHEEDTTDFNVSKSSILNYAENTTRYLIFYGDVYLKAGTDISYIKEKLNRLEAFILTQEINTF
jgi:hypothetical protein